MPPATIQAFITRWENSGAAERANYQMFLAELCDLLQVPRPDPTSPDPEKNLYVFDRAVPRVNPDGSSVTNYIDLYKAAHFVLETKQGVSADEPAAPSPTVKSGHGRRGSAAFDKALERAYHQGRDYITSVPASHGRPPFLIVCDVGHSIDLYAEFTCTGGRYERFPDPKNHRILLTDLRRPEILERLRLVFTDPHALDPSKKAAEVTRDIANRLAKLAKSLETDGHDSQVIAGFLQRCLFTMFAEDIGLLPEDGFKKLLAQVKASPQGFPVLISALWREMATGTGYSTLLFQEIACFNGGLFENTTALPLSAAQLEMLAEAADTDWSGVEPSIFGTLLTRALDSRERHKLGAEYTPRSYVERLIRPTIIEPLREEWESTRLSAAKLHNEAEAAEDRADAMEDEAKQFLTAGNSADAKKTGAAAQKLRADATKKDAEALKLVTAFHRHLCAIKVLDPACGTANFLYVTLEHLKRLEAEVLELITALGGDATFEMNEYKVRPEQFLGLEISHNAVAIAQLVLWIGYFQWQRKTTGKADTGDRPLLPKTQTIRQQDAVLAYDEKIPRRDPASGEILTIWNGYSTKPHPITGKEVPDESARTVLFDYKNPRRAEWPQADYIVGNPPFIGGWKMRDALGSGYVEALWSVYDLPEKADFVMYWWRKAADLVAAKKIKRFGFITTNSITQVFQRRVIENAFPEVSLVFAIADHPWIDSVDGAAVRIAMTAAKLGADRGILGVVVVESYGTDSGEAEVNVEFREGVINPDLTLGVDLSTIVSLASNDGVISPGVQLYGSGFILTKDEHTALEAATDRNTAKQILRSYMGAKDLVQKPREAYVVDFYGMSEAEAASAFPAAYQHLLVRVKPERQQNKRATIRECWWRFGWERPKLRAALAGLNRYIITPEVSKYRLFSFLDTTTLADNMLTCIASDDPAVLAVLCSSIHEIWALRAGGTLEDRPRYTKARCFDPFPFPALEEGSLKQRIRDLGERLDAHRKRQQELHPGLTLTGMYNVLEKLRAGETLNAKEKQIHDQGLVTLLRQIHDELDEAVLEAYGWSDLKEAPHSCGAGESAAPEKREALPSDTPSTPRQECRDSLLTRLVALNHERAAEEKRGLIRWLRPDYQNKTAETSDGHRPTLQQTTLPGTEAQSSSPSSTIHNPQSTIAWPARLPDQVTLIRQLLTTDPTATPEQLSNRCGRKNAKRTEQIEGILETLKGLGQL
jgi:hypothetical protein